MRRRRHGGTNERSPHHRDEDDPNYGTVTYDLHCSVPGCDRWWFTHGGRRTGFQVAAANSHAYAHWYRYHKEQGHPDRKGLGYYGEVVVDNDPWLCPRCRHDCYAAAHKRPPGPRKLPGTNATFTPRFPPVWGRG